MVYFNSQNAFLAIHERESSPVKVHEKLVSSELLVLWFLEDNNTLFIDHEEHTFHKNQVVCLTEFHHIKWGNVGKVRSVKWNKFFYCVINHDSEVGCKGILFYGASELPIIHLGSKEIEQFDRTWQTMCEEIGQKHSMQEELLQTTLKRALILLTRVYKDQHDIAAVEPPQMDIIREYHFLVEQHFKSKHTVAEYADMMAKSPKTLANAFKRLGAKSPQQFIKERRMLEARRLLHLNALSISEVGYTLGFADVQSFSRFFKREQGVSPMHYVG